MRLVSSAWFGVSAWRGVYVLLEKRGMTLAQVSAMVMFHWPGLSAGSSGSNGGGRGAGSGSGYTMLTIMMFVLIIPAQLIAPLASGSVSWVPGYAYSRGPDLDIPTAAPGLYWEFFSRFVEHRSRAVLRAAARSSTDLAADLFNASSPTRMLSQRHVNALSGLPAGTTVDEITMPYISIDSLEWIDDIRDLPSWIPPVVESSTGSGPLDFSQGINPMTRTDPGTAAVLKNANWSSYAAYPAPTTFSGEKYVAMLVSRTNNVDTCPSTSPVFGPVGRISLFSQYFDGIAISCFAVAKVKLFAGQTLCRSCQMVAPSVVQASSTNETLTIQQDPLVPVIFDMLPEVMGFMATMNTTSAPTYDNADHYLRGTVALAYQASWNSLTDLFSDSGAEHSSTGVSVPRAVIRASVSRSRMVAWLGLNLLLTVSGLILMWLQSRCSGKTVRDFTLAAILMDPQEILRQDESGLCNAVSISKADRSLGALRLEEEEAEAEEAPVGSSGGWHHRKLVLAKTSAGNGSSSNDNTASRDGRVVYAEAAGQTSEGTGSQKSLSQASSWSVQDVHPLLAVDKSAFVEHPGWRQKP